MRIDNFLITLQNTAGLIKSVVVSLWYEMTTRISKERNEIYGNKKVINQRKCV